jgi:hypothetical protein
MKYAVALVFRDDSEATAIGPFSNMTDAKAFIERNLDLLEWFFITHNAGVTHSCRFRWCRRSRFPIGEHRAVGALDCGRVAR